MTIPLSNVITIDDERIRGHRDRVVRGTVGGTLDARPRLTGTPFAHVHRREAWLNMRDTRRRRQPAQGRAKRCGDALTSNLQRHWTLRSCGLYVALMLYQWSRKIVRWLRWQPVERPHMSSEFHEAEVLVPLREVALAAELPVVQNHANWQNLKSSGVISDLSVLNIGIGIDPAGIKAGPR